MGGPLAAARLLVRFWSASLTAEMEYGVNAVVELLSVLANLAGSLFVLSLFIGMPAAQLPAGSPMKRIGAQGLPMPEFDPYQKRRSGPTSS
jgi:hypothetical protein